MAKTRALLTDTDRDYIAGEGGDDRRYQAASRVRGRIEEELPQDVAVLEEHHPELLAELRDIVCEQEGGGLLSTIFGDQEQERDFSASKKYKIDLSEEEHDVAYTIPLRRTELEALATLLDLEADAAFAEDEGSLMDQWTQEALQEAIPDGKTFRDSITELRREIRELASHWATQVSDDLGVVYFPIGTRLQLKQYLYGCEVRMEADRDTLDIPDDVLKRAQTLLGRVEEAENTESRLVIVSQEQLPPAP